MYIRRFISVLAAAVSVGICVFITYISRDVDRGTILFNLTFLGIMLLMLLVVVLFGVRRLMQVCKGLRTGIEAVRKSAESGLLLDDDHPLFQNEFLDGCYQQYCRMAGQSPDTVCDIRNFINEESIENYVRRGILELIPDILTSLGILGTFVGLMMGLREFDPSGYEQMAGSVSPLINGIKVAFITSIYGISLSLAYSFDLRSEFANLSVLTDQFLDLYYLNVKPPYEVDSLSRLLGCQRDRDEMTHELTELFVVQMSKSFEQVITPAFSRMTDGINRIVDAFTKDQAQVMTQICEDLSSHLHAEMADGLEHISRGFSALEKAQENYIDFMDRSLTRMQQLFTSLQTELSRAGSSSTQALDRLSAAQNEMLRHLSDTQNEILGQFSQMQHETLSRFSAAQNEALHVNEEQKETYQEYIRFMYQSIEKFSEVWEQNSRTLQAYSDEIANMNPVIAAREIQQDLSALSEQLHSLQRLLQSNAHTQTAPDTSQNELFSLTMQKLDELQEQLSKPFLLRYFQKK